MRKIDATKKLVAVSIILAILMIIVFFNYYFIKPILKSYEKIEVSSEEKLDLKLLTMAYLNQNNGLTINDYLFHEAANHKYEVAAEYYYLINGREHLNEYDKILELSKKIFNDKKVNFANFSINIDDEKCGKEKYSTIDGIVSSSNCDLKEVIYEIIDTYYQNSEYVVEFYASTAIQERVYPTIICDNFETPLNYNLRIVDLENTEYYSESKERCCSDECNLEGVKPLRTEIIYSIKENKKIYKMTFKKIDDYFVFLKVNKV